MLKEKSMLLSKYIEIVRPTYVTFKILPHTSIRNYNSSNIAKMISTMYKSISKSISRIERKYFVESPVKCSYMIDIYKTNVNFYFVVPEQYKSLAKEKITSTWAKITIEEVDSIPSFDKTNTTTYQLKYSKMDAFSLDVNRKSNHPLNNMLNVIDIMETDDRVAIFYNFKPCTQYGWGAKCEKTYARFKDNMPVTKEKDSKYIFWTSLYVIVDFIDRVISALLGDKVTDFNPIAELSNVLKENTRQLSELTRKKKYDTVLNTQIVVISQSENVVRANSNAISICQSFQTTQGDNELVYEKVSQKNFNLLEHKLKGIETNKVSTNECQNFIQLPGRDLLLQHKIKHINVLETEVPSELLKGYIKTGKSTYKGNTVQTYFSADREIANLPFIMLGPMGAGKTFQNVQYAKDVINSNEGLIVIDYIKKCELADSIKDITPKDRLIEIDLRKEQHLQSFAYNEYKLSGNTVFECVESANLHQQQIVALIDAVYKGDPLSGQMRKFFTSACDVVLINDNMSLRDVIRCLENHEVRKEFIDLVPKEYLIYLQDQISTLKELDDKKDGIVVGTKYSKIEHIMNRVNALREDIRTRMMFNKPATNNIDFSNAMDEGKVILIKMHGDKFRSEDVKNVLTTFFISKIWLACNIRGVKHDRPLRYHLLLDEIFQAPTAYKPLSNILRECRKFQLRLVFTAHQLTDLGDLQSGLKSAGASYMLLQKTDKANFKVLEQEFAQHGFTIDDLLNLKRYHSLNLISYSKGYAAFIADLEVKRKN